MRPIKLRAHHLLCVQGYKGWGLTPEFKEFMFALSEQLKTQPDSKIEIVDGADDICGHCSELVEGKCAAPPDPGIQDAKVLRHFQFMLNTEYPAKVVADKIKSTLNPDVFKEICGGGACEQYPDNCRICDESTT